MSNSTPKATAKKTKWARNIAVAALALVLVLSFLAAFSVEKTSAPSNVGTVPPNGCNGLLVRKACYPLERADTNQTRIKGLSGRENLPPRTGMLFVFERPAEQCIWMKDMSFSLDIIWLDEAKKITKIEQNVSPDTYPATFCADETKYVIELNSGDAQDLGLSPDQQLEF